MTLTQRDQVRCQGDHLKRNEVRTEILKYILSEVGPIKEPDIRRKLKEMCGVSDQGTINKHLHILRESGCVELIPPIKLSRVSQRSGRANGWDINKFKHLKNIKEEGFKEIKLNEYIKSLNIMSEEVSKANLGFLPDSLNDFKLWMQWRVSSTFFDLYLENDFKTLYSKNYEIYRLGKGYYEYRLVQKCISEVYNDFVKLVSINLYTWLVSHDKHINRPLISDVFENFFESFTEIEISEEAFHKALDEVSFNWDLETWEESCESLIRDFSDKISKEIWLEIYNGLSNEKQRKWEETEEKAEVTKEICEKISDEIYNKLVKDYTEALYKKIINIKLRQAVSLILSSDAIFNNCYGADIIKGSTSPQEVAFKITLDKKRNEFATNAKRDPVSACMAYFSNHEEENKFYFSYFELHFNNKNKYPLRIAR